jgi:hypothetical protein
MDETGKMFVGFIARHWMTGLCGSLVTLGLVKQGDSGAFVEIGTGILVGAAGLGWSWWKNSGQAQVAALLKKVTNRQTTAAAVVAAEKVPPGSAVTPGLPAKPL